MVEKRQSKSKLPKILVRQAELSMDGVHRYTLTRIWDFDKPKRFYILLNPSTADHLLDDPTVRRCVGFAHRDGFGSFELLNLFAFRSPDPDETKRVYTRDFARAIGPENDAHLLRVANAIRAEQYEAVQKGLVETGPTALRLVFGWGSLDWVSLREGAVRRIFMGIQGYTLKPAAHGPSHPLYLPGNSPLTAYP